MEIVPLNIHTEYSVLDSTIKIKELIKFCKDKNIQSCAITDLGGMYGAIEFYNEAKKSGVNPIIGCEFYICENDIVKDKNNKPLYHLILLAKNNNGYSNLCKLNSFANMKGWFTKHYINHKILEKYNNDLICLSGCMQSEVSEYILDGDYQKAFDLAKYYKELFKDDYYIELQDQGLKEQKKLNSLLIKIAKELNISLVITNDSYYLHKEDANVHDILLCIKTRNLKNDPNRIKFPNNEFYVKTKEQLKEAFSWMEAKEFEKCIKNTNKIAQKCNFKLPNALLPDYKIPIGYTESSFLEKLVLDGLQEKYNKITPQIETRYKYELSVINNKRGLAKIFLIVWDCISYAKEHNISIGIYKGSFTSSLIAYIIGITEIEPLKYSFQFDNFYISTNSNSPEIVIDINFDRRMELIDYLIKKYGSKNISSVINFETFYASSLMRDVARVFGMNSTDFNNIFPFITYDKDKTIDDFLEECPNIEESYINDVKIKEVIDIAKSIEGQLCNIGMPRTEIIISKKPLIENIPLVKNKFDDYISAAYPLKNLNDIGLFKINVLGNIYRTIIQKTIEIIKSRKTIKININNINFDDRKVYGMLSNGNTKGIYQLESDDMITLLKSIKPHSFEDLCVLIANNKAKDLENKLFANFTEFLGKCQEKANIICNANITYKLAYLKYYYPVEYMSTLLSTKYCFCEFKSYISECQNIGIKVMPPDINKSFAEFTPEGNAIRFGLFSISWVGKVVVENIIKEREENGVFTSICDFCNRIKNCDKKCLESLIKTGAFDYTNKSRKQLYNNINNIIISSNNNQELCKLKGTNKEFSTKEMQGFEKDLLGCVLSQ